MQECGARHAGTQAVLERHTPSICQLAPSIDINSCYDSAQPKFLQRTPVGLQSSMVHLHDCLPAVGKCQMCIQEKNVDAFLPFRPGSETGSKVERFDGLLNSSGAQGVILRHYSRSLRCKCRVQHIILCFFAIALVSSWLVLDWKQ